MYSRVKSVAAASIVQYHSTHQPTLVYSYACIHPHYTTSSSVYGECSCRWQEMDQGLSILCCCNIIRESCIWNCNALLLQRRNINVETCFKWQRRILRGCAVSMPPTGIWLHVCFSSVYCTWLHCMVSSSYVRLGCDAHINLFQICHAHYMNVNKLSGSTPSTCPAIV